MNNCPCCANQLLRHVRHNHAYWFCSHCWQEMPILASIDAQVQPRVYELGLSISSFQEHLAMVHS